MVGLFGSLAMGQRSLQVQRQGIEVAGHNLANVNNAAYARQRLRVQSSLPIQSSTLLQGSGVETVAIENIRSQFIDQQMITEASLTGFLDQKQAALQYAQADLGQTIDRKASGAEGTAASSGVGGQHGIAEKLSELFSSFSNLSTNPSDPGAQLELIHKAQDLATTFRDTDSRLSDLSDSLDQTLNQQTDAANRLLKDLAVLNHEIVNAEQNSAGVANDLRDTRQAKLEELGKLVKLQTSVDDTGAMDISVAGTTMVEGIKVTNTLETYDAGGGQLMVRAQQGAVPLDLANGSLQAVIEARDTDIDGLRSKIDQFANLLITQVNQVHRAGYSPAGSTGADFFTGTGAGDIAVNATLVNNPSKLQTSAVAGAAGNNQNILALAQLVDKPQASLGNLTFTEAYNQAVAGLGQELNTINNRVADQKVVTDMLSSARDAVSGVSLDEEMTELVKYQRAYQASARLITTVNEMFDEVMNLKR